MCVGAYLWTIGKCLCVCVGAYLCIVGKCLCVTFTLQSSSSDRAMRFRTFCRTGSGLTPPAAALLLQAPCVPSCSPPPALPRQLHCGGLPSCRRNHPQSRSRPGTHHRWQWCPACGAARWTWMPAPGPVDKCTSSFGDSCNAALGSPIWGWLMLYSCTKQIVHADTCICTSKQGWTLTRNGMIQIFSPGDCMMWASCAC